MTTFFKAIGVIICILLGPVGWAFLFGWWAMGKYEQAQVDKERRHQEMLEAVKSGAGN